MMPISSPPLTLADFLALPETQPASEFLWGEVTPKPMPQGQHSTLQCDLSTEINRVLKPGQIARAHTELRCTFADQSLVPDIAVFTWSRIPRNPNGKVANVFSASPDWVIEILSPGQNQSRVIRKLLLCLLHGTQMAWLIDPEEELISIYRTNGEFTVVLDHQAALPVPEFAASLCLSAESLFGWLQE